MPTAAVADWQYTRWGMTPEQVISASRGQVSWRAIRQPRTGGPTEELGGTYVAGARTFDLKFTFTENRLSLVSLEIEPCGSLPTDLRSTYGAPVDEIRGDFPQTIWDDRRNDNRITLVRIFGSCLLSYGPLNERSTGL